MNKAFNGRVIIDHIPKTGGMAITKWLRDVLGNGCVNDSSTGIHSHLISRYGGLYSVISGHLNFQGECLDSRYDYLTWLRDPIQRAISWCFYVKSHPESKELQSEKKLVKAFIESEGKDASIEILYQISNKSVDHFCEVGNKDQLSDDKKVKYAFQILQQYEIVGLYEEFPLLIKDIASYFQIPNPISIPKVNVTPTDTLRSQISADFYERIAELNQLDIKLYDIVRKWKNGKQLNLGESFTAKKIDEIKKWKKYDRYGDNKNYISYTDILIGPVNLREGDEIKQGQDITIDIDFYLQRAVGNLNIKINIFDNVMHLVSSISNTTLNLSPILEQGSYRISQLITADLDLGQYSLGYSFVENKSGNDEILASCVRQFHFRVFSLVHSISSNRIALTAQKFFCPTNECGEEVTQALGSIQAISSADKMICGERRSLSVLITNQSSQIWQKKLFKPVNVSYHWLDSSGQQVIWDGERTPLPAGGVAPGQEIMLDMTVQAPATEGDYILVLTLVQENVSWFENRGFQTCSLRVTCVQTCIDDAVHSTISIFK